MSAKQQRETLKRANPGEAWAKKVDAMSAKQVTAVLLRLKEQNKI